MNTRPSLMHLPKVRMALALVLGLLTPNLWADTPFQLIGHLENFCLTEQIKPDGTCPTGDDPRTAPSTNQFAGAQVVTNGITVIVPANLVIQMPAAYKTAQEIFTQAKGISKSNNESGLALADKQPPLAAFDVSVDGNIVCSGNACRYIAGLVSISQQTLNSGSGFIHEIADDGTLYLGAGAASGRQAGDSKLRLDDPRVDGIDTGRFGKSNEQQFAAALPDARYPDPRFQVDQDNPTVHALTGFPMCVPRSTSDKECPMDNRPKGTDGKFLTTFVMDTVDLNPQGAFAGNTIPACSTCDPTKQAPFAVGDHVTFSGTLANSGAVPRPGVFPAAGDVFISVHTLVADVGIYTKPGAKPSYVTLEESLIGTLGPTAACANTAECQDRVKIEGFTTDPSRTVNVYAIDVIPPGRTGAGSFIRLLHSTVKEQAVFGRFRWITGKDAGVLFDSQGKVRGATRELMARIDDSISSGPLPDGTKLADVTATKTANGLAAGTYIAPVGEYIFPEPTGIMGGVQPRLNFQCLAFLVDGWSLDGSTAIGQLSPWPSDAAAPVTLSCTN